MKTWRTYFIFWLLCTVSGGIYGQALNWPSPAQPSKTDIYSNSRQYTAKFSPSGIQLGYRIGTIPNFYTEKHYQFEIGQIRHPREMGGGLQTLKASISNGFFKNYIYGKQNSLYTLRASQGKTVFLSDKILQKNVLVGYTYRAGISAGFIKPYYIQIPRESDSFLNNRYEYIKYTEENREKFLDDENIFGSAPFWHGIKEIQIAPGVHGQGGMIFDWAKDQSTILSTEIGLMLDFYFSTIPLMVDQSNKPFFLNLYISLHLGRRQ